MLKISPRKAARLASTSESGFLLPIVVITGLILGAGTMALLVRSSSSLIGSIRQGQSRQAQEAAEAGLAIVLRELNRNYPYLLISNCKVNPDNGRCIGWIPKEEPGGTWEPTTSKCPSASQTPMGMQDNLRGTIEGGSSRYELISYSFTGDRQQGGVGEFRIKGESYVGSGTNTSRRATTIIEQSVPILPKSCGFPINSPSGVSGFPGLLGDQVVMGNNDVKGGINGNVFCLDCPPDDKADLYDDIRANCNASTTGTRTCRSDIQGNIFGGQIALPPVPTFPPADSTPYTRANILSSTPSADRTFVAGLSNRGACFIDSLKVTHCLINQINLTGSADQRLCIFSKPGRHENPCDNNSNIEVGDEFSGGIRFYFDRTDTQVGGAVVTVSGQASIYHMGDPDKLGFFGLPRSLSGPSQTVSLQGGANAVGIFIYFPDGRVGINGGSADPDVTGAIWARTYGVGVGSSGDNVSLTVPPNMGSLLWNTYGTEFGLGVREFAAVGTTAWRTFQIPK